MPQEGLFQPLTPEHQDRILAELGLRPPAAPALTAAVPTPKPRPVPSVGRIVHYVLPDGQHAGEHRPAIIVKVWDESLLYGGAVQLQVFTDGTNDGTEYATGLVWATSVQYSEEQRLRTWHWPEFVAPA